MAAPAPPSAAPRGVALARAAVGTAGIYAAYLTQGVVQERLASGRYGAAKERFPGLDALHGVQAIACFLWAAALLLAGGGGGGGGSKAGGRPPPSAYWKAGVSNAVGPTLGFLALKNISYPAQVLAKSCKMLPVMVVGTLLGGKAYSAFDYGCAAAVAAGVGLFASASAPKARLALTAPNALLGYTLCLGNLVLDGYTNAAQDAINRAYAAASPLWTMCWMNFWCGLYNAAYLFGLSTAGAELAAFCTAHPAAAADVALFCACGAVGQLFIFFTIRHFGSLSNTVITTTRKFFNILLSVVVVGHPLLPRQWAAVLLVFGGLLASAVAKAPRARGVGGRAKAA